VSKFKKKCCCRGWSRRGGIDFKGKTSKQELKTWIYDVIHWGVLDLQQGSSGTLQETCWYNRRWRVRRNSQLKGHRGKRDKDKQANLLASNSSLFLHTGQNLLKWNMYIRMWFHRLSGGLSNVPLSDEMKEVQFKTSEDESRAPEKAQKTHWVLSDWSGLRKNMN